MASFRWSAINGGGEVVRGVMEAPDPMRVPPGRQRVVPGARKNVRAQASASAALPIPEARSNSDSNISGSCAPEIA